ncbi:uncharacterized protein LOC126850941 [Cataglyphis hispanica]|uniref:uncharacterized protein LOC126850941 n=1 Tax=Cataglyphis hispanica TaxID=1086592 RepID=UPI00217FF415|nr:uncharacterized protein LOC126850941 [Cataglyphis hispanica]
MTKLRICQKLKINHRVVNLTKKSRIFRRSGRNVKIDHTKITRTYGHRNLSSANRIPSQSIRTFLYLALNHKRMNPTMTLRIFGLRQPRMMRRNLSKYWRIRGIPELHCIRTVTKTRSRNLHLHLNLYPNLEAA